MVVGQAAYYTGTKVKTTGAATRLRMFRNIVNRWLQPGPLRGGTNFIILPSLAGGYILFPSQCSTVAFAAQYSGLWWTNVAYNILAWCCGMYSGVMRHLVCGLMWLITGAATRQGVGTLLLNFLWRKCEPEPLGGRVSLRSMFSCLGSCFTYFYSNLAGGGVWYALWRCIQIYNWCPGWSIVGGPGWG